MSDYKDFDVEIMFLFFVFFKKKLICFSICHAPCIQNLINPRIGKVISSRCNDQTTTIKLIIS